MFGVVVIRLGVAYVLINIVGLGIIGPGLLCYQIRLLDGLVLAFAIELASGSILN